MPSIGIIGASNIGQAVAQIALRAGYQVRIANSRGPETLADLVTRLGSGAKAVSAAEAAGEDVVVVAIPLVNEPELPVLALAGSTVIDADNYYPARDGQIPELDDRTMTSATRLQQILPDSTVVKTFNQISWVEILSDPRPPGAPDRRALAVFGDDPSARQQVRDILDTLGFDSVDGGTLVESWRIEPGQPGYNVSDNADELQHHLLEARRPELDLRDEREAESS